MLMESIVMYGNEASRCIMTKRSFKMRSDCGIRMLGCHVKVMDAVAPKLYGCYVRTTWLFLERVREHSLK